MTATKYVIYMHKNKIDNKVYIGQTCKNPPSLRWANGRGYTHNAYFSAAIEKYGWENFEHIILEEVFSLEEANLAEQKWIAYYDSTNKEKGYNLSAGGKSNNGFHHSEETKEKMKKAANKRPVICLETEIVYESLHEASRQTGISVNNILDCCSGRQISTFNTHWQFYGENQKTIEELENSKYKKQCKKVECIETGIIYKSAMEASRELGIDNRKISECCRGKRQRTGGYHWRFAEVTDE